MKNYFDLTDQVAVITGCSTGLGVQMAEALANQGCNIVCLARRKEKVDETMEYCDKIVKNGIQLFNNIFFNNSFICI